MNSEWFERDFLGIPLVRPRLLTCPPECGWSIWGFWCRHCDQMHLGCGEGQQQIPCYEDGGPFEQSWCIVEPRADRWTRGETPSPGSIREWSSKRRVTDDYFGDFIHDVNRDPTFPDNIDSLDDLRVYLRYRRACDDCIATAPEFWQAYASQSRRLVTARRRYLIFERDGFRCRLCGLSASDGATLHVDHIKPVAKGGSSDDTNLWTLCRDCNLGKSDSLLDLHALTEQPL